MDRDFYLMSSDLDGINTLITDADSWIPTGLSVKMEISDEKGNALGVAKRQYVSASSSYEYVWFPNEEHTPGHVGSE